MTLSKKSNLPKLDTLPKEAKSVSYVIKTANKELGQSQCNIDNILCYDHTRESTLFRIVGMIAKPTKPQKSELVKQIEKELLPNDYNYKRQQIDNHCYCRLHVSHKKIPESWVISKRMCKVRKLSLNITTSRIYLCQSRWNAFGYVRKTENWQVFSRNFFSTDVRKLIY